MSERSAEQTRLAQVLWGHRFVDVFTETKDGRLAINYSRFHDTEPVISEA